MDFEEEQMAKMFCQEANNYFHEIKGKIYVVPSLRKGRDMDLVVWMHFDKYKPSINTGYINNPNLVDEKEYKLRKDRDVWFNSSLLIVNIKFPVDMRIAPSLVVVTGTDFYAFERNGATDLIFSPTCWRFYSTLSLN
jgi:hypothetical protein